MLLSPPRSAQRRPNNVNLRSGCRFREKKNGNRCESTLPVIWPASFTTEYGNPVRASSEYATAQFFHFVGRYAQLTIRFGVSHASGPALFSTCSGSSTFKSTTEFEPARDRM